MSTNQKEIIICQICERELNNNRSMGNHLRYNHLDFSSKKYYDTFFKKDGMGICLTCSKETEFYRGNYRKYCSNECGLTNPDAIKKKVDVRKQTMKDNPEISKKCAEKRKKTLDNNPEIEKKRIENYKKTLADDSSIVENRKEAYLQTLADNPEININRAERTRQTLVDNPEKEAERGKNISIALRNYNKSLHENHSEENHYLYIMAHQTKPIIKIGLTNEKYIQRRIRDIYRTFGEIKLVFLLKDTYKKIDELETFLHDYFNEFCKVQPEKKSGRTEWFDKKIMEDAINLASSKLEQIT